MPECTNGSHFVSPDNAKLQRDLMNVEKVCLCLCVVYTYVHTYVYCTC